ncbi:hypothetical protein [Limosilactobacillus reuteri]|uniref:hypothetical protein n=1 Tax=Limosilactobacillus reuteri TaxID=1598 RepID=UPI001158C86D|nr:hypothetical protein [Limosilactobacillus reuteri]QDK48714.1 hypothetical protein DPH67_06290 [Limosilactobacillus reuteri]
MNKTYYEDLDTATILEMIALSRQNQLNRDVTWFVIDHEDLTVDTVTDDTVSHIVDKMDLWYKDSELTREQKNRVARGVTRCYVSLMQVMKSYWPSVLNNEDAIQIQYIYNLTSDDRIEVYNELTRLIENSNQYERLYNNVGKWLLMSFISIFVTNHLEKLKKICKYNQYFKDNDEENPDLRKTLQDEPLAVDDLLDELQLGFNKSFDKIAKGDIDRINIEISEIENQVDILGMLDEGKYADLSDEYMAVFRYELRQRVRLLYSLRRD